MKIPTCLRLPALAILMLLGGCDAGSDGSTAPAPEEPAPAQQAPADDGAGEPSPEASHVAVGTWHLESIQSMDDAVGTATPDPDQRYVMTLKPDGSAAFELNCNRATSTWSGDGNADSGSLEFSPVAMTRALCPPPSLDERIAKDLPYVRSYVTRDGKLYLSLMADGGIYSWMPEAAAAGESKTENTDDGGDE